jgi:uncharacterized protein (TIGR03437 family)
MVMYISGAGQTVPPSQDGQVNQATLASPSAPVQINGATVVFAGAAPGLATGIFQVNFIAPLQTLNNVSVTVGNASARLSAYVQ